MLSFLLAASLQAAPYTDDLDRASLLSAIDHQLRDLQTQPAAVVALGEEQVTTAALQTTLRIFRTVVVRHHGTPQFNTEINRRFRVLAVADQTLFTAYYVPSMQASRTKSGPYLYPFYAYPTGGCPLTRGEIDGGALAGKGLELAWVRDPFARYSLMIEGSGLLTFEDGSVKHLNYAGNNGHPYKGVEQMFQDWHRSTGNPLNWASITRYFTPRLESFWPYQARNPRYIFFRLGDEGPFGLSRIPLTAGRSIATDKRLYPAGGLAFIDVPGTGIRRFVVDQDKGAAITGKHHVDLFVGGGEQGKGLGTHLLHQGRLHYLLARPEVPAPTESP
ncbi:MAG: MltA domain-containing protein [Candidatus Sericytochromatia bacterium]|nr:MltA domain-containing protein [Candidatus Sericytochromatia bacterium]